MKYLQPQFEVNNEINELIAQGYVLKEERHERHPYRKNFYYENVNPKSQVYQITGHFVVKEFENPESGDIKYIVHDPNGYFPVDNDNNKLSYEELIKISESYKKNEGNNDVEYEKIEEMCGQFKNLDVEPTSLYLLNLYFPDLDERKTFVHNLNEKLKGNAFGDKEFLKKLHGNPNYEATGEALSKLFGYAIEVHSEEERKAKAFASNDFCRSVIYYNIERFNRVYDNKVLKQFNLHDISVKNMLNNHQSDERWFKSVKNLIRLDEQLTVLAVKKIIALDDRNKSLIGDIEFFDKPVNYVSAFSNDVMDYKFACLTSQTPFNFDRYMDVLLNRDCFDVIYSNLDFRASKFGKNGVCTPISYIHYLSKINTDNQEDYYVKRHLGEKLLCEMIDRNEVEPARLIAAVKECCEKEVNPMDRITFEFDNITRAATRFLDSVNGKGGSRMGAVRAIQNIEKQFDIDFCRKCEQYPELAEAAEKYKPVRDVFRNVEPILEDVFLKLDGPGLIEFCNKPLRDKIVVDEYCKVIENNPEFKEHAELLPYHYQLGIETVINIIETGLVHNFPCDRDFADVKAKWYDNEGEELYSYNSGKVFIQWTNENKQPFQLEYDSKQDYLFFKTDNPENTYRIKGLKGFDEKTLKDIVNYCHEDVEKILTDRDSVTNRRMKDKMFAINTLSCFREKEALSHDVDRMSM